MEGGSNYKAMENKLLLVFIIWLGNKVGAEGLFLRILVDWKEGRGDKTTSGNGQALSFAKFQRAVENREKWRKLVVKSSVVPQRPSRLRVR